MVLVGIGISVFGVGVNCSNQLSRLESIIGMIIGCFARSRNLLTYVTLSSWNAVRFICMYINVNVVRMLRYQLFGFERGK